MENVIKRHWNLAILAVVLFAGLDKFKQRM